MIVDSSEDAAYLPLLQVTLKDLWQRGSLKLEAYRTLADALRRRAEEIYTYVDYNGARQEKRTATDQQTLIEFFLDLVEVSLDNNARRDVRIQRRADDLHRGDTKRKQLVEDMCNARLLSKSVEIREDQPVEVVNVIHETLISHWERLRDAIADHREAIQQRVRFELALKEWQAQEKKDPYLLTGVRLAEAQALDKQGDVALQSVDAQDILNRSIARRDRQRRRVIIASLAAVVVFAVLAAAAGWFGVLAQDEAKQRAIVQAQQATEIVLRQTAEIEAQENAKNEREARQTQEAETLRANQQSDIAFSRQLAAQAGDVREENLDLSLLLAVQADNENSTLESNRSLGDSISVSPYISTTLRNHLFDVKSVAWSPDGQTLASASCGEYDGESYRCIQGVIILWDVSTGQLLHTLNNYGGVIKSVAWSPDGQTLASASSDKTVQLWRFADAQLLHTFKEHTSPVNSVAWSPDGQTLASVGDTVKLWRILDGQLLRTLEGHKAPVNSVVWSPDGQTLASSSSIEIHLWHVSDTKSLRTLEEHTLGVNNIAWSPDGQTITSASRDGKVRLWRVTDGQLLIDKSL